MFDKLFFSPVKKITLEQALIDYINTKRGLKESTKLLYIESVDRYLSDWKKRPIVQITKQDIAARHQKISEYAPYCANRVMDVFQAVWNFWAIEYPEMPRNPAEVYRKQGGRNKEIRRKQDIKPAQLPQFWGALGTVDPTIALYIRLIYFTGMRRREAAMLRWSDINSAENVFVVSNTKNSRPLILPITNQLCEIFNRVKSGAKTEWVFQSPRTNSYWQEPRKAVEKVRQNSGVYFTIHSLRNTFITIAKRHTGLQNEVIKALVNHSVGRDVTDGYAAPLTVDDLRIPAQKVADDLEILAKAS
jgi:integrase